MVNCSAIGCANRSAQFPNHEVTFHRLPNEKHKELRQLWLNNIRRKEPLPKDVSLRICSVHFEESCYERDLQVYNFSRYQYHFVLQFDILDMLLISFEHPFNYITFSNYCHFLFLLR